MLLISNIRFALGFMPVIFGVNPEIQLSSVIPAKAGIQYFIKNIKDKTGAGLRGSLVVIVKKKNLILSPTQ